MVAAGSWMVLITLVGLYLWRTQKLETKPLILKALLWSIPVPYIANTTGWYMAEVGRQPWMVYGLQKVEAAISPAVSAGEILTTMIAFTVVYGVLAVADLYLLVKFIKQGPEGLTADGSMESSTKGVSLWT